MTLQILWFCLIAILWGGYFVLEGFDFGVGMLLPFVPRADGDPDALLESIGPFWDGNEVWLVVAGGATFAAFPSWYATMFSGFYLALLLILLLLIVRVVSFEWRTKSDDARWRRTWLGANVVASYGAPFLWGVALANLLHSVPLNSSGDFSGNLADLFNLYTVFAGIAVVALFALHGATFLTLRTEGALCDWVSGVARRLALPAALIVAGFVTWTIVVAVDHNDKSVFPPVIPAAITIAAMLVAVGSVMARRTGWAFAATALATIAAVATLFTSLYPRVLVSSPNFGNSLTVSSAASSHYTLVVITVVALVLVPVIVLYQAWTYYVFRARITGKEVESPTEIVARQTGTRPA
jgi:cytochrome d ubiquinol oxidase subunit II